MGVYGGEVNLFGCQEAEFFTGSCIEVFGDGVEFGLRMNREVRAFGQILSDKSVGVFIAAALPRRMRVGKINRQVQIGGDLFVQRHFLARSWSGSAQEFRHRFQLADEAL